MFEVLEYGLPELVVEGLFFVVHQFSRQLSIKKNLIHCD